MVLNLESSDSECGHVFMSHAKKSSVVPMTHKLSIFRDLGSSKLSQPYVNHVKATFPFISSRKRKQHTSFTQHERHPIPAVQDCLALAPRQETNTLLPEFQRKSPCQLEHSNHYE